MTLSASRQSLQLRSLLKKDGTLELSLTEFEVPKPGPKEVVVRVEAAPINPSDQGLLFGTPEVGAFDVSGTADRPVFTTRLAEGVVKALSARVDHAMAPGNEGAGTVIEAGSSPEAQALLGKVVGVIGGGGMYAQHRVIGVDACLPLKDGATAEQGASSFVNPMTALGMVENMRLDGHTALIHTAAASNLGQMLHRICEQDGIPLVNIVRKPEQEALLRGMGAKYVCDSSKPTFRDDLAQACYETGATIAFDATGGGKLGGWILAAMEVALQRKSTGYSRYGTETLKQIYLYGGLDMSPTEFSRSFGMAWSMGGWLVFPFWKRAGMDAMRRARERVANELTTTFASGYAKKVSLAEMLSAEAVDEYAKRNTGVKYLVVPNA